MEDYYDTLGVDRTASADDIKRAYHKMAHKYHPDKSGGDEEKFKKVSTAYQVLKDPSKRSQYDQYGRTFDEGQNYGPFKTGSGAYNINFEDLGGFGSIFDEIFTGGRTRSRQTMRGSDINVDATISFLESAASAKRDLNLRILRACDHCHGNGAEPGTPIDMCATCQGRGTVEQTSQTMFGAFRQRYVCSDCQGEGKKPKKACSVCRGQGRKLTTKTLTVDIPAGIKDGQSIRVSGQGEAAPRGGINGDLYVTVRVKEHKTLRREGNNVRSTINVSFIDAALGSQMEVETLAGPKPLTVPAGTQPGAMLKLVSFGFTSAGGGQRGDHLVTVNVEIPKRLSKTQKELLTRFRESRHKHFLFG